MVLRNRSGGRGMSTSQLKGVLLSRSPRWASGCGLPWAPQNRRAPPQNVLTGCTRAVGSHRLLGLQVCRNGYVGAPPPRDPRGRSRGALRRKARWMQGPSLRPLCLPPRCYGNSRGEKEGQEDRRWSTRKSAAQHGVL